MAVKLTSTAASAADRGIKVLVHGPAGAGKTTLCGTTGGKPIIISAEAGLLSLRHLDIPVIEVASIEDVGEAYAYLASGEGSQYDWVCLDSISEIAEVCLAAEKAATRDPRQAYGALSDRMFALIRAFRDLPGRNVLMSCKQARETDSAGNTCYVPAMPGQKLGQGIGYFFDFVFALRVEKDGEGKPTRWLQTNRDLTHEAKDRSGCLELFEPADIAAIAAKVFAEGHQ
jgi:hypothetical protein